MATLFLAGDSTLDGHGGDESVFGSWGEALRPSLRDGCAISNHAKDGRSTKSFADEGRWGAVLDALSPGDFVLIQFGHNDQKADQPHLWTPVTDFCGNLCRMAAEVRANGAKPVFATPIVRLFFENGRLVDPQNLDAWAAAMRDAANEEGVPLVDMRAMTRKAAESAGEVVARTWYAGGDSTHPAVAGARIYASLFLNDVRRRSLEIASLFTEHL